MPADKDFSFFAIDPNRLDEEWIEHPRRYHQLAMELADARAEHERAKASLEVIAAEIDRSVRLRPEDYGFEKVTEKIVENTVVLQDKHKTARRRLLDAKHAVDVAQVAVDTMEHKKKALENAVQLFLSDYWSKPRERGGKGGTHPMGEREAKAAFRGAPLQ
jgi:signal transduction protein with GAF and PtsI domain